MNYCGIMVAKCQKKNSNKQSHKKINIGHKSKPTIRKTSHNFYLCHGLSNRIV